MENNTGELKDYGASISPLDSDLQRLRVDIKLPPGYITELVVFNIIGVISEYVGRHDIKKCELVVGDLPSDASEQLHTHLSVLQNKGFDISL
jgi:hypothetical protein